MERSDIACPKGSSKGRAGASAKLIEISDRARTKLGAKYSAAFSLNRRSRILSKPQKKTSATDLFNVL